MHSQKAIGGYFELELPSRQGVPHEGVMYFQSARASFLALLREVRPERVWMPKYICDSMLGPLELAGVECAWYDLDERLHAKNIAFHENDLVLYVNYFGLCGSGVQEILESLPPDRVVLDFSQSFFAHPFKHALATIYSPRKFFGVPDGGLLYSPHVKISDPEEVDVFSLHRVKHLILRLAGAVEEGYLAYQEAEKSIDQDVEPKSMSVLTRKILNSIDYGNIAEKRSRNFSMLSEALGNRLLLRGSGGEVPLCFPYVAKDGDALRRYLMENRVYVPTYWTEAVRRLAPEQAEALVKNLVPLPIDQRLSKSDIERLSCLVLDAER